MVNLLHSIVALFFLAAASASGQGIVGGLPANVPLGDTARIVTMPQLRPGVAGSHGFVKTTADGRFAFDDGSPARFVGVTLDWTATMPDSAQAVRWAARMAKLGINLVRLRYFDGAFWWAEYLSVLERASDFKTLNPERMRRLDWFVHQLRLHGIYTYLTLQSMRAPLATDGYGTLADSAMWLSPGLFHMYPQGRTLLKNHARLLLDHVNEFTGRAYRDEPAIAMIELMHGTSILANWKYGYLNYAPGGSTISYNHSRRLDTMFAQYLRNRYSGQQGLDVAWRVAPPGGFPNLLQEGSFEGAFDQHWQVLSSEASVTSILTQNDSVPDGEYALTLRVRNAHGAVGQAYMTQSVPLQYNTLYRLSFRGKASNPEGRNVYVAAVENSTDGVYAGLSAYVPVTNAWQKHEVVFLTPAVTRAPVALYLFFGDVDGDLSVDDVRLEAVPPVGLLPTERIDSANITRIPWGNAAAAQVSTQRVEDQSEFLMSLDRDLFTDMRAYVRDSIKARQPITGSAHTYVSTLLEGSIERTMDFSTTQSAHDWVAGNADSVELRNYSPLRMGYAVLVHDYSGLAHERQPHVVTVSTPHPNRYLAEMMTFLPAYALHQGWDAVIYDLWADDNLSDTLPYIGPTEWYEFSKNPVFNALLPATSAMFREGLVAPATGTIRLEHTPRQIAQGPRFASTLGRHGFPTSIPNWAMAVNRIVHDSLNAAQFSQTNDISFPPILDDEVMSDTRELRWEFNSGVMSINSPKMQAATGHISRSGGVSLDMLNVQVLSNNETATVMWVSLDSTRTLDDAGRSFLVVASRAEVTGTKWRDTTKVIGWGKGPMIVEPVRARLTFKLETPAARLLITPLDSLGRIGGDTLAVGSDGTVTIDQSRTRAQWYEVVIDRGSGVNNSTNVSLSSMRALRMRDGRIQLEMRLARGADDATLDVYDAVGRRCASATIGAVAAGTSRRELDIEGLANGSYTVMMRSSGGEPIPARMVVVR